MTEAHLEYAATGLALLIAGVGAGVMAGGPTWLGFAALILGVNAWAALEQRDRQARQRQQAQRSADQDDNHA